MAIPVGPAQTFYERINPDIVRIRVDAGTDVNSEIDGRSVVHEARTSSGRNPKIVQFLIDAGAVE